MNCRVPRRALGRFLAAGLAASLGVSMWGVVAGATSFTTPSAEAKVHQTQTQITQIEQTIQHEQRQSAVLSEQYDSATAHMQAVKAELDATDRRLRQTRRTIARDKKVLAKAVVNAYVLGTQHTQITSIFSTAANTAIASQEYSRTAIGNLDTAKRSLQGAKAVLASTLSQQQSEEQQAQAAVGKVQALQQQNQQAAQQSEATLTSLKGALGTEVAAAAKARAQRKAAAAAAAAAAARARAAALAAAQAAAAARVASELGTSAATTAANRAASAAGGPTVGFSGTATAQGAAAVRAAESQLGVPYVWGGESPGSGFDCSGLTQWSWGQAGVSIPRTSESQYAAVPHVSLSNLQPGDLLFYFNLDGTGTVDHVAMYVGSGPYGNQTVIQAPQTGETVSYVALYTYGLIAAGQP